MKFYWERRIYQDAFTLLIKRIRENLQLLIFFVLQLRTCLNIDNKMKCRIAHMAVQFFIIGSYFLSIYHYLNDSNRKIICFLPFCCLNYLAIRRKMIASLLFSG